MLYKIGRLFFMFLLNLFCSFEIKGTEHIPKDKGFILASNHVSNLDPIVLGVVCPRRLNFMAKDKLFSNPIFSWVLTRVGAFPVRRNASDFSALKKAINRLREGNGLVIFPEGTRQTNTSERKIQPGIGFIAEKSNSSIVPSFIQGTDRALPKGAKFIRPSKISVYFGKEIIIERSESHNYQEIANSIMYGIGHLACR